MVEFDQLQKELLALPEVKGIVPVDILSLPHAIGPVIRGLMRNKTITSAELADAIGISKLEAQNAAGILVDKGYLLLVEDPPVEEQLGDEQPNLEQPGGESSKESLEELHGGQQNDASKIENDGVQKYRIHFARIKKHGIPIDL